MDDRGLLTEKDREIFRGETSEEISKSRIYNIKSHVRNRLSNIEEDLLILEEAGEEEFVDEILTSLANIDVHDIRDRISVIEDEIDRLKSECDQLDRLESEVNQIKQQLNTEDLE